MPKLKDCDYEAIRDQQNSFFMIHSTHCCTQHFHKQLELAYCTSGTQVVKINSETLQLNRGDILIVSPFMAHGYELSTANCLVLCIPTIFYSYYSKYFSRLSINDTIIKNTKGSKEVFKALKQFHNIGDMNHFEQTSLVLAVLGKLLHLAEFKEIATNDNADLTNDIINYIDQNFKDKISLESLSDHLHYNKTYISKYFNKAFNCSFNDYINTTRLNAFVELQLENGGMFSNNALSVGFQTTRTFYNAFKLKYKNTPTEFFQNNLPTHM